MSETVPQINPTLRMVSVRHGECVKLHLRLVEGGAV